MDVGIGIPNCTRGARGPMLVEWGRRAEAAGFSSVATIGRVAYPGFEELTALAAVAAVTERIGLYTNILLGTTRQPKTVGSGPNAAVPPGSRRVPVLFGGFPEHVFPRVARFGAGWSATAVPPDQMPGAIAALREAWRAAGREGTPRVTTLSYFGVGDPDGAGANIRHYYDIIGIADMMANFMLDGQDAIKDAVTAFSRTGVDEMILVPGLANPAEVERAAEAARG